jgi:Carboxypeptidase regulatory-like domain
MLVRRCLLFLGFSLIAALAAGQQQPAGETGSLVGVVTDAQDALIPGATIQVKDDTDTLRLDKTNGVGAFAIHNLPAGAPFHVTVSAPGFGDWTSDPVTLSPGQVVDLKSIRLIVAVAISSVSAATPEQVAVQQVDLAERQRLFGILPNFYVTYDTRFVPLSPKLKGRLALRTAADPATLLGAGFLAGINQASDVAPHYEQGATGYAKRFGAAYVGTVTDLALGSAVFPIIFRQDPRYFYKGTGSKKSRLLRAITSPFVAKGDNGRWQPNISSICGDFSSSALASLYYPKSDRDASLIVRSALEITGIRVVNGLLQEFVYHRLTTNTKRPRKFKGLPGQGT